MCKNVTRKHHYIPVFYLKQWASKDGRICEFSKPYKNIVKPLRKFPDATGYEKDLYVMPRESLLDADQIETKFMKPLDSLAAQVLEKLLSGKQIHWTSQERSAWSRFLMSLRLRAPVDVAAMKKRVFEDWKTYVPEIQAGYKQIRGDKDPPTFEEFIAIHDPLYLERNALKILTTLIDNAKIGSDINNMNWHVLNLAGSDLELLTCDVPVMMQMNKDNPHGHISLPISPSKLFLATNSTELIGALRSERPRNIVRANNEYIVARAKKYVYGFNDSQIRFIQNRMSTVRALTVGEMLLQEALKRTGDPVEITSP